MTLQLDLVALLSLLGAVNFVYLGAHGWFDGAGDEANRVFRAICGVGAWWAVSMGLVHAGLGLRYPLLLQSSMLLSGFFGPLLLLFTLAWLGWAPRGRAAVLLAGLPGTIGFLYVLVVQPPAFPEVARAFLLGDYPERADFLSRLPVVYVLNLVHAAQLVVLPLASVGLFAWAAARGQAKNRTEAAALAIMFAVAMAGVLLTHILPRLGYGAFWPRLAPLVTLPLVGVLGLLLQWRAKARQRLAKERAELLTFLPTDAVNVLLSVPEAHHGRQHEAAVLFADLRGFTTASERVAPTALIEWVNRYFSAMSDVVLAHGGMVDKLIGDGVLAVFGVPSPLEAPVEQALRAAEGMVEALAALEAEHPLEAGAQLHMGVGVHFGICVAGTVGNHARRTYTVFGDVVNTASRLEELTKELPTAIVLSEAAVAQLDADRRADLIPLGEHAIRGRREPVTLYGAGPPRGAEAGAARRGPGRSDV